MQKLLICLHPKKIRIRKRTNTYKAWSEITTRTQWDQTGQKHSAGYGGGCASLVHVNNTPARRLFEGLHVSYTHCHLLLSIVFDFLSILNLTKWIILYQKPHKFPKPIIMFHLHISLCNLPRYFLLNKTSLKFMRIVLRTFHLYG